MKLTTILLIAATMHVAAAGNAQKVTMNVKNVPLKTVFVELNKQTGYNFLYSDEVLAGTDKVTIKVKDASIEDVLSIALKNQPLEFSMVNNTIVVKPKEGKNINDEGIASLRSQRGSQPIDVKGRVVNEAGEPVEGASVMVKGTKIGTTTNANGEFQLSGIDENAVLVISGVSIEPMEIAVAKNLGLKTGEGMVIKAVTEVTSLQEVVINKGYYTEKQKLSVSNVGRVTAKDIEKQPVNNPLLALQGRVPGITITQSNGVPGSSVNLRIQGRNNLSASFTGSDPLIVIDGVPYPSQNLLAFESGLFGSGVLGRATGTFSTSGSTLSMINPADIESVDILKDADATAIYGSRAANGAILITTKKGNAGNTKIDIGFQTGWGKVAHKWDLLNTRQYLEMRREAIANSNAFISSTDFDLNGFWDTTRYTNWQEELIGGTANFSRLNATISGGNSQMNYLVGGTYGYETTVFPGKFENQKGSLHFNINGNTKNNRFQLQLKGSYFTDNNVPPGIDFTEFITLAPNAPALYNADGSLNWAPDANGRSTWDNPLSFNYNVFETKSTTVIGNATLNYKILPGLDAKVSLGHNSLQSNQFGTALDGAIRPESLAGRQRMAQFTNSSIKTWIAEPQISYSTGIGEKGKFKTFVGTTFQENISNGNSILSYGQSSDLLLRSLSSGTTYGTATNAVYRYNAIFARLNYVHNDRYILNIVGRRDGSSRFGSNNLFHTFGSVAAGWIFSEESLIKKAFSFLSFGKLKGSYGLTGNDQIKDYLFMSLFGPTSNSIPYQTVIGLESQGIRNPNLQWEETRKLQAGLDFGFFSDKLFASVNFFRNRTNNTLTNLKLPFTTGTNGFTDNFPALIQNSGWEFTLNSTLIKAKNLSWSANFNVTIPRNKLVAFPDLKNSLSANDLIIGQPLDILLNYNFAGIDPATGAYLYKNSYGDITSTLDAVRDRVAVLNNTEKLYGGFGTSLSYKNIQFDFQFQFVSQKGVIYPFIGIPGRYFRYIKQSNQPVTILNRWQKPGDLTSIPPFSSTLRNRTYGDRVFQDASFTRLKNFSLTYIVDDKICKKLSLKAAKAFINGQNLFTLTNYEGLDPETKSITNLPPLRVITVGIQISL